MKPKHTPPSTIGFNRPVMVGNELAYIKEAVEAMHTRNEESAATHGARSQRG